MSPGKRAAFAAMGLLLSSCARTMREIPPAPGAIYPDPHASCARLVAERARRTTRLVIVGLHQDQLAADDRARVLGVPTPLGTPFEEDMTPEVARLKGEIGAITQEMIRKNCGRDYQ